MENISYSALVVHEETGNVFSRSLEIRNTSELPPGDLLIRVHYSSLNYKDALSASGNRGVTKRYPHVPGIDAAGLVEQSTSSDFNPGDPVIVSGFDLGMNTPGGFGQYIRVPADWALPCPWNLSLRETMMYGTAGFTAAQSVLKLIDHPLPKKMGKILVSGATGGVGAIAISILAKLGYSVTAVSGKVEAKEFLQKIGAAEIITRQQATDLSGKLLLREKWDGVIDTVGGEILATAVKSTTYGGVVTCCGNVASPGLPLSVYPFILRGVSLLGIDSAQTPLSIRRNIWQKLAEEWKLENLDLLAADCTLEELPGLIDRMLQGRQTGRMVVNLL